MCTSVPGFQSFYRFFALFGFGKLAISSIRVKAQEVEPYLCHFYVPLYSLEEQKRVKQVQPVILCFQYPNRTPLIIGCLFIDVAHLFSVYA